jgi:type I restriction enzyme M protein
MAIKKTELYSSLWASCDELRGGMDASQYKDYVLTQLFMITPKTSQDQTVYDPTCGSGSLLLKVADEAPRGLSIFGQEMDSSTAALARMNMILHDHPTAEMWKDNTLSAPYWKNSDGSLKAFDFAVANPPFSYKSWSNGISITDDPFDRFGYGTPPDKNGDYAFLLHILKSLKSKGKGAVILPHGVLFRGNAEARIRENLLRQGYIKGIIGLPANLFYGTGIPACIIVIDKEGAAQREGLFMVDASKGFMKDGNKNRLRSQDIHKIVDVFTRQIELPRYSRMVSLKEILRNDYNLNIPRYIDSSEPEDLHDLNAHLNGGIPNADIEALEDFWRVFPQLRGTLFATGEREGYSHGLVEASQVKATILNHPEFTAFAQKSLAFYTDWCKHFEEGLKGIAIGDKPKALIQMLSEDLLARFAKADLLDKYDIYQLLMDYWAETMQDDVYLLVQDGWAAGNVLRELSVKKGEKLKETPDLVIDRQKYKADLIPPGLIVARYFADEQAEVDRLVAELDTVSQELEALIEEHSGEEGLLMDAQTDAGKVSKATVAARLKAIKGDVSAKEERTVLKQCLDLFEQEVTAKKAVKDAQTALDEAVFAQYRMRLRCWW